LILGSADEGAAIGCEFIQQTVGQFGVHKAKGAVIAVDDRDFTAKVREDRRIFHGDDAGAEHGEGLGHVDQPEDRFRVDDIDVIDIDVAWIARPGAAGDHEVIEVDLQALPAYPHDLGAMVSGQPCPAMQARRTGQAQLPAHIHLVGPDHLLLALHQALDLGFSVDHHGEHVSRTCSESSQGVGGFAQGFGWNGAVRDTGTTDIDLLLDDQDGLAHAGGADRRLLAGRATSDDEEINLFVKGLPTHRTPAMARTFSRTSSAASRCPAISSG
jgi:hypothetical protein